MNTGKSHNPIVDKKKIREVLARKLQAAIDAGETQTSLAQKAGTSQAHISRLLNCEAAATVDLLPGLAKALRCQPWELLLDDEEARKEILAKLIGRP